MMRKYTYFIRLSIVYTSTFIHGIPWHIPSTESIQKAISEHKTTTYGLAGSSLWPYIFNYTHDISKPGALCCASDLQNNKNTAIYWNWANINATNVTFSKDFIFGVGTSAYQIEGNSKNADWWQWEYGSYADGTPHVKEHSGIAADGWNRYKDDSALMAQTGVGIYRFSIAWDKVQPTQDMFDSKAIEHYIDVCKELEKQSIYAIIVLHHYTDPVWFADLGGFTKEQNISYFVSYCSKIMESFKDISNIKLWATFNSPTSYAFHKYDSGDFPPGIKNNKELTLNVVKNMLEAHVQAYQECKKINPDTHFGILVNNTQYDPWRPQSAEDNLACSIGKKLQNDGVFKFLTTGIFEVEIPPIASISYTSPSALDANGRLSQNFKCLDFIGLNYYSHVYLKGMQHMLHPYETATQNPYYALYPEGLYRAIKTIQHEVVEPIKIRTGIELPIYITENGIASTNSKDRLTFFHRYIYALNKAHKEHSNVKGYIYWSFMDNYEWGTYDKKYGLVHIDFSSKDLSRTIKTDAGTQYYINLMKQHRLTATN